MRTKLGVSVNVGASATGKLRFEVVGTSLKVYFNDVLRISQTDSMLMADGMIGLRGTAGSTFDTFVMSR